MLHLKCILSCIKYLSTRCMIFKKKSMPFFAWFHWPYGHYGWLVAGACGLRPRPTSPNLGPANQSVIHLNVYRRKLVATSRPSHVANNLPYETSRLQDEQRTAWQNATYPRGFFVYCIYSWNWLLNIFVDHTALSNSHYPKSCKMEVERCYHAAKWFN